MPFAPGRSGNPGGRPSIVKEVQELARQKSARAIEVLAEIADDAGSPSAARVSAAVAILDRAFGKPAQAVTGEGGEGPILASIKVEFVRPGDDGAAG